MLTNMELITNYFTCKMFKVDVTSRTKNGLVHGQSDVRQLIHK